MRVVLGLIVLAGCSRLFGFEEPTVAATVVDDAAPDDAEQPPVRCSTFHSFVDSFDDTVLGSQWQLQSAGANDSLTLSGGELHFQATGTSSFLAIRTRGMYRFDDTAFTIDLPRVDPDAFTGANKVIVFLRAQPSLQFELTINNHLLTVAKTSPAPAVTVAQFAYDPVASRFLRFDRVGGKLQASDSSDGITFRVIGVFDDDVPVARAFVGILRDPASQTALVLDVAGVNASATPDPLCSPGDFAEPFDGELSIAQWETDFSNCSFELDGVLRVNSGEDSLFCRLTTAVPYDLHLGSFTVDVPPPVIDVGAGDLELTLEIENNSNPTFIIEGDLMQAIQGSVLANATYDPMLHRFLRFRAVDNALQWETSADGTSFDVLATSTSVALGRARLAIVIDPPEQGAIKIAGVNSP